MEIQQYNMAADLLLNLLTGLAANLGLWLLIHVLINA